MGFAAALAGTKELRRAPAPEGLGAFFNAITAAGKPLLAYKYWGCGDRAEPGAPEREALERMERLSFSRVAAYPHGIRKTLAFSDTHAHLNGYAPAHYGRYFKKMAGLAREFGWEMALFSDLAGISPGKAKVRAGVDARTLPRPDAAMMERLAASAFRRTIRRDHPAAALEYWHLNARERGALAAAFPGHVFITYNQPADDDLLVADDRPVLHWSSFGKGRNEKPWFVDAVPGRAG